MMPSPAELTYFIELAHTGNFSRASERLGISQPSLSIAMQRLELSVGASLFIRSKKGVTLTQAGKQLLAHSRELTQRWQNIRGQALASKSEMLGSYTIGCHPSVAIYSLPHFLANFLEKYPNVEINLTHDLSRKIAERVVQLEVDIGIVVNPMKHPDLVIRKLCDDEITLWVGQGNRKIQAPHSGDAVLLCEPDLIQTQSILRKLKASGIKYTRVVASSNLEVLTDLAASGAGIAILPERVAMNAHKKGLHKVPKCPTFQDEISAVIRVENKNIAVVQALLNELVHVFRKPAIQS